MSSKRKKRVSKAEFVAVLALVAHHDREAYRVIRKDGWEACTLVACSSLQN